MPSRRRRRNHALGSTSTPDSTPAPSDSQNREVGPVSDRVVWDSVVWTFVFYWASAHFWLARKCSEKVNKLLFRLQGFDRQASEMLCSYWTPFTFISYMLTFMFSYVCVVSIPVLYIVFADVIFMCIFWISEEL